MKYKVTNGRYGIRKEEGDDALLKYFNFSYLVLPLKPFSSGKQRDNEKSIGIPLMPNADDFYAYQILSKITKDNEEILEIYCTPSHPENHYFECCLVCKQDNDEAG